MKTDARTGRKGIDKKSPLPLTDAESITGEALGLRIIQGLHEYKEGKVRVAFSLVKHARDKLGMTKGRICQDAWRIEPHACRLGTGLEKTQWRCCVPH